MKIIGQLKAILGLDKTKFDRGLDDAGKKASAFGGAIKKIGAAIAGAFALSALKAFTENIIGLAAKTEGVKAAFERLNQPGMLSDLRTATRGTVTDLQLMQKAVQAKNFKIPLSQLATYFEFATKRALQTGESVDYLVDSIITGIGHKSVRVIDNLGISAVELQQEIQKTGDFGIAFGNIIKRESGDMGDVADTTASQIATIGTAWNNLKTQMGRWIISSGIGKLIEDTARMFEVWSDPDIPLFGLKSATKENVESYRYKKMLESTSMYSGGESEGGPLGSKPVAKQAKTIKDLRAELDLLKTSIDETLVSDQARRTEILLQIKDTEKLIEKLTTLDETIKRTEPTGKTRSPLIGALSGGIPSLPGLQGYGGQKADDMQIQANLIDEMNQSLMEQSAAVGILSQSFNVLFTSTEDGFKNMIESIITGLKRLVAELLARMAVLTILNAITGGGAGGGNVLKGALSSMGFIKMASGGTVPPGYPGDTYPALLSSGETVLTAHESRSLGRSINVKVTGDIQGRAIGLLGRRMEDEY